jgi:hypothetical protein
MYYIIVVYYCTINILNENRLRRKVSSLYFVTYAVRTESVTYVCFEFALQSGCTHFCRHLQGQSTRDELEAKWEKQSFRQNCFFPVCPASIVAKVLIFASKVQIRLQFRGPLKFEALKKGSRTWGEFRIRTEVETWDFFAKFASSLEFASSSPVWTDPQLRIVGLGADPKKPVGPRPTRPWILSAMMSAIGDFYREPGNGLQGTWELGLKSQGFIVWVPKLVFLSYYLSFSSLPPAPAVPLMARHF